ncbi:GNAT family N-acetyltransferase [Chachezhania sediminis]|uniref:GNAT family N-acetyltransferase n=1 Tax=Chachezhania sediminis TaxID=2599291 RepID=UPI00131D7237|nr:GNAT family N-acetyltransferase [Chachezhania sediminis]
MSDLCPERCLPDDPRVPDVLSLIQRSFAFMDARINPPSSMVRLTAADVARQCETGEVWIMGTPPVACVFLTLKPDCLYLGKLAVDASARGQGLARVLVDLAEERARDLGLPEVELQVRVELIENHAAFGKMGFVKVGETAHEGYDRPTSITMRKAVTPSG